MNSPPPDILQTIVAHKKQEIDERQAKIPLSKIQANLDRLASCRGFVDAIHKKLTQKKAAVIAEIKKASPSKGVIRENFKPGAIALSYEKNGAACVSVLTDRKFFQGDEAHLQRAREATALPILRKDFTIDAYQVYEARYIGADCILLIATILSDAELAEFSELATDLGMDTLIEVHDRAELQRVLGLDLPLIGINNRNLRTFDTRLETTLDLLEMIGENRIVVAESGIHTPKDVELMRQHGVNTFLVGEAFMRADDPGVKLAEFFA